MPTTPATPTTVPEVIARMKAIERELPRTDGVAVFNRVYLTVTEKVLAILEGRGGAGFRDNAFLAELDIRFANLWLAAYDASRARKDLPKAWAPLFEGRSPKGRVPLQHALAGMNAHIEHDLPIALWKTCEARRKSPDDPAVKADYQAVNSVLAEVEAEIRRSFLTDLGRAVDDEVDDRLGPVAHLVSSWNIEKARDVAWVNAETIWELRRVKFLLPGYLAGLAGTVGMGSRILLTPVLR